MELPRIIQDSRVFYASTQNYQQLISLPGTTLVMYDNFSIRYRNDQLIRRAVRKLVSEYNPRQLENVIIVDLKQCPIVEEYSPRRSTFRLYCQGRQQSEEWVYRPGDLRAWLMEFLGPPAIGQNDYFFFDYDLLHGVRLRVWNRSGRLTVREIADGLALAMQKIKQEEPDCVPDKHPYRVPVNHRRTDLGRAHLQAPLDREVTREQWKEAVTHAYTTTSTVEQMLDNLQSWKDAAEKDGGEICSVLANFERPGGDLHAISSLLCFLANRRGTASFAVRSGH